MNKPLPRTRPALRRALAPALLLAVAACQRAAPEAPPLAGARIGGAFTLTDQDGRRFDSRRLAGRYPLIYFGYTSCPDVCPTDLAVIGQALKAFAARDPARAATVQPIFISVDPARDTPAVLRRYVAAFHPRLIGLTGTPAEIAAVAREYAVSYRAQPPAAGAAGYLVDHSRMTILFGADGAPIALVPADQDAAAAERVLEKWVR